MFEKTVNFDEKNSWKDYKIIFKTFTLGAPSPQLVLINVPFRNGSLDETDYFGDVKYNDRTLSMDFLIHWAEDYPYDIYSNVLNKLNGQRKRIKISADQGWYYEGRLTVGDLSIDSGFWNFSISAIVDPYKYRDSGYDTTVAGSKTIEVYNEEMRAVPIVTTSGDISIIQNGTVFNFKEGSSYNPLFKLEPGINSLSITGNAAISLSYRQGRL